MPAIGYLAATGSWRTALIAGVALLVALFVSLFLYWRRFSFRVGSDEIRIDSGIFSRTHRSIPFDRIQDVDITQGPVARLLGIAKVKFETGGSAAAKDEDGVLPAITLARAEALRDQVREPPRDRAGDCARTARTQRRRCSRWTSAACCSPACSISRSPCSPALFGAIADLRRRRSASIRSAAASGLRLLDAGGPIAGYVLAHQVGGRRRRAGRAGADRPRHRHRPHAGCANSGFRLDRSGTGLRRRRGLLTLTDVTLPLRRVQAALDRHRPAPRPRSAGASSSCRASPPTRAARATMCVAPLARDDEVAAILAELGWSARPDDRVAARVARLCLGLFARP